MENQFEGSFGEREKEGRQKSADEEDALTQEVLRNRCAGTGLSFTTYIPSEGPRERSGTRRANTPLDS